jgi:Peptidase family M41
MSDKIGPMAWGSQGQVFLGEDLMHTRDYSEHTSQVIDDEVEIILRAQEERALDVLARHRGGLDAVARALLDEETIDGETVGRLVDTAYGRPVHAAGVKTIPPIFVASQHGPTGTGDADGPPTDGSPAELPPSGADAQSTAGETSEHDQPAHDPTPAAANRAADAPPVTPAPPSTGGDGNGVRPGQSPWPTPAPPAPPAAGSWPKQAPWPPPPPPPTSR